MMKIGTCVCFCLVFYLLGCTPVRLDLRKGKDVFTDSKNWRQLNCCFVYDANGPAPLLSDWVVKSKELPPLNAKNKICLTFDELRHVTLSVISADSVLFTQRVKGHYSQGYFHLRRRWCKFPGGPFFWNLNDAVISIGLTKKNDICLVYRTGGELFFLFFPFMAANGPAVDYEFRKL